MPETDHLRVERRDDGALWLTFDRPEVLNALSDELSLALAEQLELASSDDAVRCVVLTGAGGSFSAGADISGEDAVERFDVRALDAANRIIRAVTSCATPVVAAVRGVAAGVGASAALAADLVVAHEDAQLLLAFARIGLMPDGGSSATVAAATGRARAMRMALLGEPLTGREAYDAGLVSHVAGADFDEVVAGVVGRLVRGAPLAQAATKKAVNAATLHQLEAALERERTGQTVLLRTEDAAEGMRAFGERRRPDFKNR
ncbi:enoyl-CoA hydratase [Nocardioides anomalus]|uniref:Enoyl-CoA hydratase n=1 Tax=Nocardioides anomalus TaxID=2712223 RepID=A0A6G6W9S0_9ACTN|nr:enoyl-CoA hydratase-related protein [Nocardioides anomalus]QIG41949.1 enoyl-CoA hydratase [Nocardioides anomalus]